MAYTKAQQDRIDAAQTKVASARNIYEAKAGAYTSFASGITCYAGGLPTVDEIKTRLWTPNRNTCSAKGGSCNQKSKTSCEVNVDHLNNIEVPELRASWDNYDVALKNLTTVTNQVIAEAGPATQQETAITIAENQAEADRKAKQLKNILIFAGFAVLVIVGAIVYIRRQG